MAVKEGGDRGGVRDDPGDVRGRREASDLQGAVGVLDEAPLQIPQVDMAVGVPSISTTSATSPAVRMMFVADESPAVGLRGCVR